MGALRTISSRFCALAALVGCAVQQSAAGFEGVLIFEPRAIILDD